MFRAEIAGGINRIEFLGVGGIGKSYFNNKLTQKLGEIALKSQGGCEQTADYEEAFARLFRVQLKRMLASHESKDIRLSKLRNFMQVMELDDFISHNQIPGMFTTASGLVHWTRPAMMDLIETEPEVVKEVMSGRLVVYCTSTEPGRRSAEGLVKRGSMAPDRLRQDFISRRNSSDHALGALAESFQFLGLPVVRLNLDEPIQENIKKVCKRIAGAGVSSARIRKQILG